MLKIFTSEICISGFSISNLKIFSPTNKKKLLYYFIIIKRNDCRFNALRNEIFVLLLKIILYSN